MKPSTAFLFDLDGTLLDSAPDLVGSLNWVRASEQLEPLDVKQMSQHASRGAMGLINAGMPPSTNEQLERWKEKFLSHYAANSFVQSSLYPQVEEFLEFLHKAGIPWGLVTNKAKALTIPILEAAGLINKVGCVVCGDTLPRSKPDPEPVLFACKQLGMAPAETLFVGDDIRDMQAGAAAGTILVAVQYGYGSGEIGPDSGIDAVFINHAAELFGLVKNQFGTKV